MKIVIISALYTPHIRGGAEVVVQTVVNELKKEHTVTVITTCEGKGLRSLIPKKTNEDDITLYRFFPLNIFSFITILRRNVVVRLMWHIFDVFNIHSFFTVRSLLKKERPDLVLTHNLKGIGYLTPLATHGFKTIHTVHDFAATTPSGVIVYGKEQSLEHTNPFTQIYAFINKKLFSSIINVVFPSKFLKEFYEQKGFFINAKRVVLPNPIKKMVPGTILKMVPGTILKLLFVGQLEEHKGILFLLDALKNEKGIHLTIIGSGRCEQEVKKICEMCSHYEYKGFIPSHELTPYFQQANFLVIPSLYYENAPMVLFESSAAGTPAIGSRIGGISEIICEGENGFLFEPADKNSLLAALKKAQQSSTEELCRNAQISVQNQEPLQYIQKLLSL